MESPYLPGVEGVDFKRDYAGEMSFGDDRNITLNGVLYRQTESGVFRVQNGQLIPLTASERAMFTALDNGTFIPTQNTTTATKDNKSQDNSSLIVIGVALFVIVLLKKGD